jgi:hypothetical protein
MSLPGKAPSPNVPEIKKCPRCGNDILIGDRRCSRCGYNLSTLEDSLKSMNPMFIAFVCLMVGGALALAATGMDGIMQLAFLGLGSAIVIGGGVFMGLSYIVGDSKQLRK